MSIDWKQMTADIRGIAAERDAYREALEEITKAQPRPGVPLKDTLAGCRQIARTALANYRGGKQ